MKSPIQRILLAALICIPVNLIFPSVLHAQPLMAYPSLTPSSKPAAQRNALNALRAQVNWFRNATRAAPSYATGSYGMVLHQFELLREAYSAFKTTLTPDQLAAVGNELAELEAGLDILQEAFDDYQQDVAAGRAATASFKSLCQTLNEGASVWLNELNKTAKRLRL